MNIERLTFGLFERAAVANKRHAQIARPGANHETCVQFRVIEVVGNLLLWPFNHELSNTRAVNQDFKPVRTAEPFNLVIAITCQTNLNLILPIARKRVAKQRASTRSER